ncbi:MAG: autotransporter domain-containing protein [Sutterellaceae bacterium]|nr:autotransporter domain-containing protein [Sutterellaceae bacterium]
MNKTFKVVFNRARATLMVANEVTSSVKKKGVTKVAALVATGLVSAFSMSAYGATYEHDFSNATASQVIDLSKLEMKGSADYFVKFDSGKSANLGTIDLTGSNISWNNGYSGNFNQGNIIYASGLKSLTLDHFTLTNNQIEIADSSLIGYGAIVLRDQNPSKDNVRGDKFDLSDFTIENNSLTVTRTANAYLAGGSVFAIWDIDEINFTNGVVNNNHAVITGTDGTSYAAAARGGFMEVKRGNTTFTDVVFTNNTAETVGGKSYAIGGAILADGREESNGVGESTNPMTVTFAVTEGKSLVYSGNNVVDGDTAYHDTWGHMAQTGGGFLFLDRGAKAKFEIATGATLTIGNEDATGDMDSIASSFAVNSYVDQGGTTRNPITDTSNLTKSGSGTLILNGSLNKYYGTVTVEAGEMRVNKDWTVHNTVEVKGGMLTAGNVVLGDIPNIAAGNAYDPDKENPINTELTAYGDPHGTISVTGGTANIASLTFNEDANTVSVTGSGSGSGTLSVEKFDFTKGGKVTVNGGTLQTSSSQVYTVSEGVTLISANAEDVTNDFTGKTVTTITNFELTSGTLALTDAGYYTTASLKAMSKAASAMTLTIVNAQLVADQTTGLIDNVIQSKTDAEVTGTVANNSLTIESKNSGAQSLIVASNDGATVTKVVLASNDSSSTTITLVGSESSSANTQLVTDKTTEQSVDVNVSSTANLSLGSATTESETYGSLSKLTLEAGSTTATGVAKLAISNSNITVDTLEDNGNNLILVGSRENRGSLTVGDLSLGSNSAIFVDPAWEDGVEVHSIDKASHLEIANVSTLDGKIIAGQNSLVTLGATTQEAIAAFNSLSGMAWGPENVTAALYLAKTVTPNGGILVDGSLESYDATKGTTKTVTLAANALLIVDQAALGTDAAVDGTLTVDQKAKIAIVNANVGETKLSTADVADLTIDQIVTDNQFITATAITGGTVTTAVEGESLAGAFSSLGLQAMTRRADTMLATSIADRTSIDQDLGEGLSLWVDVAGERYEADGLDNGGEFHSDMGYGTFGGDIQVADGARVGAAIQYGSGSARSDNLGIKNSIDSYGFSLYGSYAFGDAKLVGELAYVKNENDITADATSGLSQSVDTEILSAGLRAQYALSAGQFRFMPSIGLRVSQLKSDELKVGNLAFGDDDLTLVQVPVALRITGFDMQAQGWQLSPSFKLAWVPTFGDKDVDIYGVDQTVIDTNPVQGDFGLRAVNGNMMINANFMFGAGKEGTSSVGGKIGMKYVF